MRIGRRWVLALASVVVALPLLGWGPAHAAGAVPPTVVAGPGSFLAGFYTGTVVAQPGAALTFSNGDFVSHNVVSVDFGPDTPACAAAGFAVGQCPVFWSVPIGVGQTAVNGTENLVAGKSYAFYCATHPASMRGTLTASA